MLASVELKKRENRDDLDILQMNGYVPCIYIVSRVFIIFVIPFYVGSECGDTFLLIISWCMECHLSPVGQFSQVHRVF
jgi:hypothetical protein